MHLLEAVNADLFRFMNFNKTANDLNIPRSECLNVVQVLSLFQNYINLCIAF